MLEGLLGRCGSAVAPHGHRGPGSGSPGGLYQPFTIQPSRLQGWASGEATNRGAQPRPSAENWIKVLLSMALPITARLSCSHHRFTPIRKLTSSTRGQTRSKKGHNLTAARTKTASQKVNHDEKAEGLFQIGNKDKTPEK